jgi:hypothetical protein
MFSGELIPSPPIFIDLWTPPTARSATGGFSCEGCDEWCCTVDLILHRSRNLPERVSTPWTCQTSEFWAVAGGIKAKRMTPLVMSIERGLRSEF